MAAGNAPSEGTGQTTQSTTLDAERGVNERYRHELERMVEQSPHLAGSVGAAPSGSFRARP